MSNDATDSTESPGSGELEQTGEQEASGELKIQCCPLELATTMYTHAHTSIHPTAII